MSKEEILLKLVACKAVLLQKYPISSLAIFGSFARNEQVDSSDIDILVDINGKIGSRFIDLAEELEKILGRKVDLVSKRAIRPAYLASISSDIIYV